MVSIIGVILFLLIIIVIAFFLSISMILIQLIYTKLINKDKYLKTILRDILKNKKNIVIIILINIFITLIVLAMLITLSSPPPAPPINEIDPLEKLIRGKIGYDIPDTMKVGKQYKAIVSITESLNDSILLSNLKSSHIAIHDIKLSSNVKVYLIDPTNNHKFNIIALNSDEQFVNATSNTVWRWNIIPLRSGRNELILRATVKILSDIGETSKDIEVFERIVIVHGSPFISLSHFIQDNWQWSAGTIIIPLLIWRFKKKKTTKKKAWFS